MFGERAYWIGVILIAALVTITASFPNSFLGRELRRTYRVQTTGVSGRFAPRDFARAAAMSFVIGVVLFAGSVLAFWVTENRNDKDTLIVQGFGFGCVLLSLVVFASIIQTGWRGIMVWRRDQRVERVRAAHLQLFAGVREILKRHNIMALGGEEAEAEFDYEAARLLTPLLAAVDSSEFLSQLHTCFALWFTLDVAGPRERFATLGEELWNARRRLGTASA